MNHRKHCERVAAELVRLTGVSWSVRLQHLIATHLPSGRIFYADREGSCWAGYTCASMQRCRHYDLRFLGAEPVRLRAGEEAVDLAALLVGSMYERARDDPRNATRYWPSMSSEPYLLANLQRQEAREARWAVYRLTGETK